MFHDRPYQFRKKILKLLEIQKKADEVLSNINFVMGEFKKLYLEKGVTDQKSFEGALSQDLINYGKDVYSELPPKYLYRYMRDLRCVRKTINDNQLMYRRPKCFDDKKEVDLHRLSKENHNQFSKESVETFKAEMNKLKISEQEKEIASHNLDQYRGFYDELRENTHICCFSEDPFAENPGPDKERWEKYGFKGGMIVVDTEVMQDFHKAYYSKFPRVITTDKKLNNMAKKRPSLKKIRGSYCDIVAKMYVRLYKKDRKWSWEKEWRSVIIGKLKGENPETSIVHDCDDPGHNYYRPGIDTAIIHVIIGINETEQVVNEVIGQCNSLRYGFCQMNQQSELCPVQGYEEQCEHCKISSSLDCDYHRPRVAEIDDPSPNRNLSTT